MVDLSNLYSGYQRAATYNRVDKNTLLKALKPYKLNFSSTLNKSDVQLRHLATQTVVARYLAAKNAK
jgi:hypothetical protein